MNTKVKLLSFAVGIAAMAMSCKKTVDNWIDKQEGTVYDTVVSRPDNRIITYAVKNTGEYSVKGSIDNDARMIRVFLPYYYQLLFMEVEIVLPDGASISPSAEELVPVFATSPFKYTVKGKSGQTAGYTVVTVIQQPTLRLNEVSTSSSTRVYNIASNGFSIGITGENFLPSYTVTSLHLMDENGNEIYKFQEWTGSGSITTTQMPFAIGNNDKGLMETGKDYWLEMRSYSLSYRMQYPIRFTK
jgi:hypothetical protein